MHVRLSVVKKTYLLTYLYQRLNFALLYNVVYTVSQKKLCKIVSVRTSSNFHQF